MQRPAFYGALLLFIGTVHGAAQEAPRNHGTQRIACYVGYSQGSCSEHLKVLGKLLGKYKTELLGDWNWVVIPSAQWKEVVRKRGGDVDSPAFTLLDKRHTVLEEALFTTVPVRSAELLRKWQRPLDTMLEYAMTHELAHIACNTESEREAVRNGELLLQGRAMQCPRGRLVSLNSQNGN